MTGTGSDSLLVRAGFAEPPFVACFGLDGERLWESRSPPDHLAGGAAWDPTASVWVIVHHPLDQSSTLIHRISADGELLDQIDFGWRCMWYACLPGGRLIAVDSGQLLDARTAESVWDFSVETQGPGDASSAP